MPRITIEGKRRLFFSSNAQDQSWRFKEKVVAVIESYFQGHDDLYTFSSKRIKNVAGDYEEVDVAYANLGDPTSIFDFVQIRDRKNTEGRPWIQQVLGQRSSLGINGGIMVSTDQFSQPAIRLASKKNIRLRLLRPETDENIKSWYRPSTLGIETPIVEILHCRIQLKIDDKYLLLQSDGKKSLENNILVPTDEKHNYRVISLRNVFDVDVMKDNSRQNDFLSKIPIDSGFHNTMVVVKYEKPRLYISLKTMNSTSSTEIKGIFPIMSIIFVLKANRQFINIPIVYRYKYIDAISNECIAQSIVSELSLENQRYYFSLVRYNIVSDKMNVGVGGAFFQ